MTSGSLDQSFPAAPPPDVLAELDAAAVALDALERSGASVALLPDGSRGLRIELVDAAGARSLSATELLALLA